MLLDVFVPVIDYIHAKLSTEIRYTKIIVNPQYVYFHWVIVFYIFSGYVITHGLVNGGLQNGFVPYAIKRLKRVAPTLLIVSSLQIAFLFIVSKMFESQVISLFKNFKEFNYDNLLEYYNLMNFEIFYQTFPPLLSFQFLLIPSSWSIYNEIIFYFVIFIFLRATIKLEKLRFFLIILTITIIQVIGVSSAQQDLGLLNKYVYFIESNLYIPYDKILYHIDNLKGIGMGLFFEYKLAIILAGILLLVSMVGSIVLTMGTIKRSSLKIQTAVNQALIAR